ncbi:MAG TPA: DEAD/DEAH box helicase, partial [Microbacteriaceae bacterium]|nr:DEAD/DEAH box helicase [Microbacteriaceae bacterium]
MPKQYTPKSNNSAGGKDRWTEADRRKRDERPARPAGSRSPSEPQASRSDRAARPATGDHRPARPYQDRPARGERPDWSPRPPREHSARPQRDGAARPQRDNAARPARDGAPRREWQPREGQAPRREWNDRPARDSQDRPARPYQDRPARPHQDRPHQDRPARDSHDRPARPYQDRQDRPARPYQDRPARGERPDWSPREARPARSGYGSDRPRSEAQAPRREWNDRPARTDRNDRAERTERPRFEDRAPHSSSRSLSEPQASRSPRPMVEDVVLDRLDASAIAADAADGMTFSDLGLGDNIVRQLAAMGAAEPFPIQAATIPEVLVGRDVLGRGRTGSGKTIAFGAPIVERLLQLHRDANPTGAKGRSMGRQPRAIILAPTRELAQQIDRTVQPIARSVGLFTISIVGGVPYQRQLTGLHRGVDIVIGTPGRIEDLVDKGELDLSEIAVTVLDEADHMCDLGFLEP